MPVLARALGWGIWIIQDFEAFKRQFLGNYAEREDHFRPITLDSGFRRPESAIARENTENPNIDSSAVRAFSVYFRYFSHINMDFPFRP